MKLGENIHLMSTLCCWNISDIGSKLRIFINDQLLDLSTLISNPLGVTF